MREIKFRQPVMKNGKFHDWHYWGQIGGKGCFVSPLTQSDRSDEHYQFTGLKDKSGKEIYENDLLKRIHGCYQVVWSEVALGFKKKTHTGSYLDFTDEEEVIGSVFENPELLEQ